MCSKLHSNSCRRFRACRATLILAGVLAGGLLQAGQTVVDAGTTFTFIVPALATNYAWRLEGTLVSTNGIVGTNGPAFTYAPTRFDVGTHELACYQSFSNLPNDNRDTPYLLMDGVATRGPGSTNYLNNPGTYTNSAGVPVPVGCAFHYYPSNAMEVARWQTALTNGGVWVSGFWRVDWQNDAMQLLGIDPTNLVLEITNTVAVQGGIGSKYSQPLGSLQERGISFDQDHRQAHVYCNVVDLNAAVSGEHQGYGTETGSQATAGEQQYLDHYNNLGLNANHGFDVVAPAGSTIEENAMIDCLTPYTWEQVVIGVSGNTFVGSSASVLQSGPNLTYTNNPGFVNFANEDFRLVPAAQVYADMPLFSQLPVEMMGLYNDETWSNAMGYSPYLVLVSTNLALPLANWTIVATNQFGAGGGFSYTTALNPVAPQVFYLLKLP